MRTKIRLIADISIQLLLFMGLLLQIIYTDITLGVLLIFYGIALTIWQTTYASYMVQQHADWYLSRYLVHIKKISQISTLLLVFAILVGVITLGYYGTLIINTLIYLTYFLGVVLLLLSSHYFIRSIIRTYHHYKKPRSFWDL